MNSRENDEPTHYADGGWWVSAKGDYGKRDALGPFVSEAEAKRIAALLFAKQSPDWII